VDNRFLHLDLTIFEKDLDDIFIGQKLMAFNNRNPEKKHACDIILIGKNLTADRNAEVHCHFQKYDETLIPGMFMNAEIEIQNQISEVLPDESIVLFEGKNYVFVQQSNNVFSMVELQIGVSQGGYTEILNGNSSINNKNIAVKGAYTLLMQLKNTEEE
jgi:cobalt-zinc-cadmium efflux system membrane fusion protein